MTYELVIIEAGYEDELQGTGDLKYVKRLKSDLMADYEDPEVGCQIGEEPPTFQIRKVA